MLEQDEGDKANDNDNAQALYMLRRSASSEGWYSDNMLSTKRAKEMRRMSSSERFDAISSSSRRGSNGTIRSHLSKSGNSSNGSCDSGPQLVVRQKSIKHLETSSNSRWSEDHPVSSTSVMEENGAQKWHTQDDLEDSPIPHDSN